MIQATRRWPEKEVLVQGERRRTYREWNQQVNRLAHALQDRGIEPGDCVAILTYNCIEQLTTYLATQKIGAVAVPINYRFSSQEIRHILDRADVKVLVFDPEFEETVQKAQEGIDALSHLIAVGGVVEHSQPFEEVVSEGVPGEPQVDRLQPSDTSVMMHTSGTTGMPKLVEVSHFSQWLNNLLLAIEQDIEHDARVLHFLPLFHTAGYIYMFLTHMYLGATHVLQPRFNPHETMELIEREGITTLCGIPTNYQLLRQKTDTSRYDLASVNKVYSGGARLEWETVRWVHNHLCDRLFNVYALTETTSVAAILTPDQTHRIKDDYCVGRPLLEMNLRVVESDSDAAPTDTVDPGERGEIIVSGPKLMKGYYKQPEKTAEALKDGWLFTEDVGYRDEEGFFYLVDRKDNMIISGGENIYPQEVEGILNQHPKVVESGVVGVSDEVMGERVVALVVTEDESLTFEDLERYWLEDQERLADFKRPRTIHFVSELPKNEIGKIQRGKLEELL